MLLVGGIWEGDDCAARLGPRKKLLSYGVVELSKPRKRGFLAFVL